MGDNTKALDAYQRLRRCMAVLQGAGYPGKDVVVSFGIYWAAALEQLCSGLEQLKEDMESVADIKDKSGQRLVCAIGLLRDAQEAITERYVKSAEQSLPDGE